MLLDQINDADYRYFPTGSGDQIRVFSVPRGSYGEKISRRSFTITADNNSYKIYDDGNGNLIDGASNNLHVGNIIYAQGIIIITNPDYINLFTPVTTSTTTTTTTNNCAVNWSKTNLNVATYRNGDPIPFVSSSTAWAALTTGAWCYYGNNPDSGSVYGKLYNWYAVNDSRGLAPVGWHIPTDAEWTTLETCLGGQNVAGGKLKQSGSARWVSPNLGGNNSSGFNALPGGIRVSNGDFSGSAASGSWWTATQSTTVNGYLRRLIASSSGSASTTLTKKAGLSVRLVRDQITTSTTTTTTTNACAIDWTKNNLNVATYKNGDPITFVSESSVWASATSGAWCYYNNDDTNATQYGKLYNWYAVNDPRGLAPEGYHVPYNSDWTTLISCVGSDGGALKETGTGSWSSPNATATNYSGFTGRGGGYRAANGTFAEFSTTGSWWSADSISTTGYLYSLKYSNGTIYQGTLGKNAGLSIRCKKGNPTTTTTTTTTTTAPPGVAISLTYSGDSCALACASTSYSTYYATAICAANLAVGCNLYTNNTLSTPADDGWYSNGVNCYTVVAGVVTVKAACATTTTTTTTTTSTTTSTTTACTRPSVPVSGALVYAVTANGSGGEGLTTFTSTGDACTKFGEAKYNNTWISPIAYRTFQAEGSLTAGRVLYSGIGTDCTKISDGYYWYESTITPYPSSITPYTTKSTIYTVRVGSGQVQSITACTPTTTTTTTTSTTTTTTTIPPHPSYVYIDNRLNSATYAINNVTFETASNAGVQVQLPIVSAGDSYPVIGDGVTGRFEDGTYTVRVTLNKSLSNQRLQITNNTGSITAANQYTCTALGNVTSPATYTFTNMKLKNGYGLIGSANLPQKAFVIALDDAGCPVPAAELRASVLDPVNVTDRIMNVRVYNSEDTLVTYLITAGGFPAQYTTTGNTNWVEAHPTIPLVSDTYSIQVDATVASSGNNLFLSVNEGASTYIAIPTSATYTFTDLNLSAGDRIAVYIGNPA